MTRGDLGSLTANGPMSISLVTLVSLAYADPPEWARLLHVFFTSDVYGSSAFFVRHSAHGRLLCKLSW